MTLITQNNTSVAGISSQAAATQNPGKEGSVLTSDFETFLQMLTAQAKYQDPLEPIDSSEYAAQLAQFSMVEQQVKGNELLGALGQQMGAGNMASMGGWIGMEVRTTAPAEFNGSPVTLVPNPPAAADEVFLVVRDSKGVEVQRQVIPKSADPVEWAGVSDDQTPFDTAVYSFELESYANDTLLGTSPVESYSRITEVRSEGGTTMLVLEGGTLVFPGDVTALRENS